MQQVWELVVEWNERVGVYSQGVVKHTMSLLYATPKLAYAAQEREWELHKGCHAFVRDRKLIQE